MQAGVMFMIIALDIVITLRFSINCSAVICSPTVIFSILREASSETYGPRVYFPSYKFPIYNFIFLFTSFAIFYFPFHKPKIPKILLYRLSISIRSHFPNNREGIDTLVLKTEGNTYSTLLHHPFLFKGKTNASSRSSTTNQKVVVGGIYL